MSEVDPNHAVADRSWCSVATAKSRQIAGNYWLLVLHGTQTNQWKKPVIGPTDCARTVAGAGIPGLIDLFCACRAQ